MGPGPVIRPDLPLGSAAVRHDSASQPNMPMGPGPGDAAGRLPMGRGRRNAAEYADGARGSDA
ncbi:hypothetical protein DW841_35785, partial [Hungatella hathewayi]